MSQLIKIENAPTPRARAPNFAQSEKILLLDVVSKYKNIVENKKTDKITTEAKNDVWDKIEMEFNSQSMAVFRNVEQLKNLYLHIKKKARKERSSDKVDSFLNVSEISTKALLIMEPSTQIPVDSLSNNNCVSEEESNHFIKIEKDIDLGSENSQSHSMEPTELAVVVSQPPTVAPSPHTITSEKTFKKKASVHGVYDELAEICTNKKAKLERNEKYEEELMTMKREKHELEMQILKEKFELESKILKEQLDGLKAKNDLELKILKTKLENQ